MYSFTSHVRYSEVDENWRLTIPALIDYLQDCSTFQSDLLGMGPRHIASTKLAWMLSAWKIEIRELPRFNDEIVVSTWATGFKGLRASRNFTVRRAGDATDAGPIVRADSSWFMFDSNKGRPVRTPENESAPYLADAEKDAPLDMPAIPHVVRIEDEGEPLVPVQVTAAHLDTNHHVNNAQYVAIALGALGERMPAAPLTLDVHYSQAAKLGDVIYPHLHEQDGALTVTLDNADGKHYAIVSVS
ncbi:acyl-[acyl-carrier-protein] thioesterase [uncultured Parolsenella sp.]|uniref:acyl-[acyl-carrier-protein] thioesterase n=1 Tax=uncultured Parolsenella sp. TaxID=2083008 RepID=UPI00265A81AE|nr:acyl-ACP thioesterase domain-containing protein [uncultured Parolsenella sp.]